MKVSTLFAAAMTLVASIALQSNAAAVPTPTENFTSSLDPVSTTAACLVSVSNPTAGINACLCAVSGGTSPYCLQGGGTFSIHPAFNAAWSGALGINSVSLANTIPSTASDFLVDARVDCGLTQGSFQLAVAPTTTTKQLSGVLGASASYTAVYALPITTDGTNIAPLVDTSIATPPANHLPAVRVCSYGQVSAFVSGSYTPSNGQWRGDDHGGKNNGWNANGNLSLTDLGLSVGAEWLANGTQAYANAGVQYVLVAGVADALLQVGGKRFSALGVLANARVGYRSLNLRSILTQNPG